MSTQKLKQKGFTIIEVVLVLAIAALIFLMVFIALPALQRNQRDTARKTVLGKVSSAVTSYQSNKRGSQPASGADLAGYVDGVTSGTIEPVAKNTDGTPKSLDTITASSGGAAIVDNEYALVVRSGATGVGSAAQNVIQVITGARCNDTGDGAVSGSKRNAAIIIQLENGNAYVCEQV